MPIDLSNYNTVPERLTEFKEKHPEGSLQAEIIELPAAFADSFIAVKAYAYRTPDDPRPGVGLAFEPMPGKTTYTKDSELQNAETSAWGRAIVAALAADTRKGISTSEEVRNRVEASDYGDQGPSYRRATLRSDVRPEDVERMRTPELTERLRDAGLSLDGTPKARKDRLIEHLSKSSPAVNNAPHEPNAEFPIDLAGVSPGPTSGAVGMPDGVAPECFAVGCAEGALAGSEYCEAHNG